MTEIGELDQVPLRDKWPNEENDFTPWLAENISYLSDAIEIPLSVNTTEADVGPFFADIHATTGELEEEKRDIIIENQYNQTDHGHLGKSLVYAAGFEADIIIWIAEEFQDEHIDAIQWFNERTNDETGLFAIKMELIQINDSPVAPNFTVVERPSRWKALTGDLNKTEREHYRFWSEFEDQLEERGLEKYIENSTSTTSSYYPMRLDGAEIRLASTSYGNLIECTLRIDDPDGNLGGLDKEAVREKLQSTIKKRDTETLSTSIVEQIEWKTDSEDTYDKVTIEYPDEVDRGDEAEWKRYCGWLVDASLVYDEAFSDWF
jgi:hypothetical protein